MVIISICAAIIIGLIIAVVATPRIVEYVETTTIDAPRRAVYDAIRRQSYLMKWSAWPSETGSACKVLGEDGVVGAQTVFLDKKGSKFGYQEVTQMTKDASVSFMLESKGPPHLPVMHFYLSDLDDDKTHVSLHFINDITPPFHLALRLFGVVKWTRGMHKKDLDGLKRFLERSEDYSGKPLQVAV